MRAFLHSRKAFYLVIAFFTFESLWIALSSRYPMAFDEYFHYGVGQLHAKTLSPFLSNVPGDASLYGAITRDASFLYHYLLSFPLRLLNAITDNIVWHILILRVLNIALAVVSLFVYARLLKKLGLSQGAITLLLLFLSLIPVMPLMAGQITYDNLFFLMVAGTLLIAVTFLQKMQTTKTIDISLLSWLLICGLFTCFVKYAFLPAMLAIVLVVGYFVIKNKQATYTGCREWLHSSSRASKTVLATAFIIGIGLFAGSYGVNMVKYHTPVPDCDAVIGEEACKSYGPWYRDYLAKQTHPGSDISDVAPYVSPWVKKMMQETFFMVGAKYNDDGIVTYRSTKPFPVLYATAWIVLIVGVIIMIIRGRFIWSKPEYRLVFAVLIIYTLVLFARNLQFYLETGAAVAIHGRYILPFIIPAIGVVIIAAQTIRIPRLSPKVPHLLIGLALIGFLQGGLVTFIVATNDDWMWPQSQPAIEVNRAVRNALTPLIPR